MPRIGDSAPLFSLPTDGGGRSTLSDYVGKKVVLYFYPKDDTPGCTKEACDFRDNIAAVKSAGAEILGVSPDSPSSHDEFKAKYQLPFTLLADEDHAVAEAYGAWKEKMLYGRTFMGIERTTVLIDENHKIAGVWNRVQVDGHAQHVIAVLKGEQPAPVPVETTPSKPVAQKAEAKAPAAKVVAKSAAPAKVAPAKAAMAKPAAKAAAKPVAKRAAKPAAKAKKAAPKAKKAAAKLAKKAAPKVAKKPVGKARAKKAPKKKK